MIHFDTDSPESGWQPFIDWMTSESVDPTDVFAIDVDLEAMTATVHEFATRRGRRFVRDGEPAGCRPCAVSIRTEPPRRVAS